MEENPLKKWKSVRIVIIFVIMSLTLNISLFASTITKGALTRNKTAQDMSKITSDSQDQLFTNFIPDSSFDADDSWNMSSSSIRPKLISPEPLIPNDTRGSWEYDYTTYTTGTRSMKLTITDNMSSPANIPPMDYAPIPSPLFRWRHTTSVRGHTSFTYTGECEPLRVMIQFDVKCTYNGTNSNFVSPFVEIVKSNTSTFPAYLGRVEVEPPYPEEWRTYTRNVSRYVYYDAFQKDRKIDIEFGLEWSNPASNPYDIWTDRNENGTATAWFDNIQILVAQGLMVMNHGTMANIEWNQTYGGTEQDAAYALVPTTDGGFALAGYTSSYGKGGRDMWLVKTDNNGVVKWDKTYGGTENDIANALIQTTDGGFALAGHTYSSGAGNGDMWLVKTNAKGISQWKRSYGGRGVDEAFALHQTSDGGFALVGYTRSPGDSIYTEDWWLVKTDASGIMQWNQSYGGNGGHECAYALIQTTDGGYALAGYTSSYGAGRIDMWLVKTDAYGIALWNQTYGGPWYDGAYALLQTTDGGFVLAGDTESYGAGMRDMWLVKTNTNGVIQWNQTYGGTHIDHADALVQTADGGFALAGCMTSHDTDLGIYDQHLWLVKTDANGIVLWNQTFGGTGGQSFIENGYILDQDRAYALLQTADGGFALAGALYNYNPQDCYGNNDMYLVKIKSISSSELNGGPVSSFTLLSVIAFLAILVLPKKIHPDK